MFSISTVASSTSMPTASAMPPSVIVLMVWCVSLSPTIAVRIESGIDAITISMLRGEPKNTSTMSATSTAAVRASRTTPQRAARTKRDWSKVRAAWRPRGAVARISGSLAFTASTTARVEAAACLMTMRYVAGRPSMRTTLVGGGCVSLTGATSPRNTGAPRTTLSGTWLNSGTVAGLMLMSTLYW
jgi:hypothetical protein